ncbi:MAG: PAP2 superfamily protein [Parcubacteria group bacterium GW2011_GWA2_47_64]|nr:MAG: PAP2 superfamily protein [Parcubacteria group bacterium GW2011_GWA2_47_64]KKU97034.1 MAG: PAP2 superfamily protein [Parcubacteria group bacterium GW2011_GWC2_48_17]
MSFDLWIVFLAKYFPYVVAGLFVIFALTRSQARKAQILLFCEGAAAALLSRGVVEALRLFIHRPRPFVADPSIVPLISETSFSFPSGHAAFFFALATTVYLRDKRLGVWFFLAALLIGIARVLAGVHYVTDILGGAALGVVAAYGTHLFFARYQDSIKTLP